MPTELDELALALTALGCPADKTRGMAAQLDRRAVQLAAKTGRTYDESLSHLLRLMAGGWAARSQSPSPEVPYP